MINDYFLYITVALAVTVIPGPAVVLTIKNSLIYGSRTAVVNILGNFVAMLLLASLSAVGLGAILITSTLLFSLMKVLGCLYLIYLGIKAWSSSYTIKLNDPQTVHKDKQHLLSVFKEGVGVGLSNPKAIVFFTALFPQFIDLSRAYIPQFITLIFTIEVISCLVLLGYAIMASNLSTYLSRGNAMSVFQKLTGLTFVGFGIGLLFQKET